MRATMFVTLLLWAECSTAGGLVDEPSAAQAATTAGYHSVDTRAANTTYGESTMQIACGNTSHRCGSICHICQLIQLPVMDCLSMLIQQSCLSNFETSMASLNSTDWCIWGNVRGYYSNFSNCTEEFSDCLLIPWPNPLVERTFVDIHTKFFTDCPSEELSDPPPIIVFTLVITPICLIPIMVGLVVLKTKNGDGSS